MAASLSCLASVVVPDDLRNPFEVASPSGFIETSDTVLPEHNDAQRMRQKNFFDLAKQLRSLPFLGVISHPDRQGECLVLLGDYIFSENMDVDPSSFNFPGSIHVLRVESRKMLISVSLDAEVREIEIPFQQ